MSQDESPNDSAGVPAPVELTEVGTYPTAGDGFDHGLVVLAIGSPYWLLAADSRFRLMVEPEAVEQAREQLARYDRESARWPPAPPTGHAPAREADLVTPLLWGFVLLAVYWCQGRWPGSLEEMGALDARVFSRGEAWRMATALFLHADAGHLLSNLLSGFFVFSAVATTMGRRRGWLLLGLASVGGNLADAALRMSEPFQSIGASTAVFAGLGILTGRAIRMFPRGDSPDRIRGAFTPMAAGAIVLALYGAGGVDVDALAHLTGFAAGIVSGLVAGPPGIPLRGSVPAPS